MKFTEREEKLIRLGLNTSAQGNEVDTSATKLFHWLRERGVSAENFLGNGASPDMDRVLRMEAEVRRLQADNVTLRSEARRLGDEVNHYKSRATGDYSRGYSEGYTTARNQFEQKERTEYRSEEPKRPRRPSYGTHGEFHASPEQRTQKDQWEAYARDFAGESEDFEMQFGKYGPKDGKRGHRLSVVSISYLQWCVGPKGLVDMPHTCAVIMDFLEELAKRNRR